MSKLFREMQEAANGPVGPMTGSTALAELLTVVGSETEAARQATASPLQECKHIELHPEDRPVLLTAGEQTSTHPAFEAYRALRTKLSRFQSAQGVRSILISSAVAGEGKTITSMNVAMSMAQLENQRVLLVDGDIRTAGLSHMVGTEGENGLGQILTGKSTFQAALRSTNVPRLYMVSAGEALTAASDLFAGPKWQEFIGWCNEMFDMVIVDCPPILGLADFDLISGACDGVLIVVRARKTKRETLTEIAQHLQGKKVLGLILNGQERQRTNYYGNYYYTRTKGKAN
jgi:protein-tyrosine kinase